MQELEVNKMEKERISYKELYELIGKHISVVNENIKETNQNIKETNTKLDNLHNKVESVLIQTTRTNGRVSALETWEAECNRIISELRAENKEQNKQLNITALDLTKITLKVSFILSVIGFVVYIFTGFVI
jgi:chromosome segregation ATPase